MPVLDTTVDIHLVTVNWWGYSFPCRPYRAWLLQLHWPVPHHPSPTCHFSVARYLTVHQHQCATAVDRFNICPVPMACRLWLPRMDFCSAHQQVIKICTGRLQRYTAEALVSCKHIHGGMRPCHQYYPGEMATSAHILLSLWEAARLCPMYVRTWQTVAEEVYLPNN